jgi:hypothetical protein
MAENFLLIPELNPIIFYDVLRGNLNKYFTKHFENFKFDERLYYWQQRENYKQVWQTDDIIYLQFESTFDPIVVSVLDQYGIPKNVFPALIGLPNKFIPGTYTFEVEISLADLTTGCYYLFIEAGSGDNKKQMISDRQYVSSTQLKNTLLLEYWHSNFHKDVLFETGIKFQFRVPGSFGFLDKVRKDTIYRDEKYNSTILDSKSAKQWPVFYGDQFGLPDDIINLIDEIWSCDNVRIDNKSFCIADGSKADFVTVERYPKRGYRMVVEEGINRNSRIFNIDQDATKKLITTIIVDAKVFGDTSNQGSSNAIPVFNIE